MRRRQAEIWRGDQYAQPRLRCTCGSVDGWQFRAALGSSRGSASQTGCKWLAPVFHNVQQGWMCQCTTLWPMGGQTAGRHNRVAAFHRFTKHAYHVLPLWAAASARRTAASGKGVRWPFAWRLCDLVPESRQPPRFVTSEVAAGGSALGWCQIRVDGDPTDTVPTGRVQWDRSFMPCNKVLVAALCPSIVR